MGTQKSDDLFGAKSVHTALKSLQRLKKLATHPLASTKIVEQRRQEANYAQTPIGRGKALRDVLTTAIEELKPNSGSPDFLEKRWRPYLILRDQFVNRKDVNSIRERLRVVQSTYFAAQKIGRVRLGERLQSWEGDLSDVVATQFETDSSSPLEQVRMTWGEAPDVTYFYGREDELATLKQWVVGDRCRLVGLLGIGGVGKTMLATKVSVLIEQDFEYVFWCSLLNAPSALEVVIECSQFLSQQGHDLHTSFNKCLLQLIEALKAHRCLVVFDNVEAILRSGGRAGHYREGCEEYGILLRRVGETAHQSCVLLTSREKPKEIALMEGEGSLVRSLSLDGVSEPAGRDILKDKGLSGREESWRALWTASSGNPLVLKIVSERIREVFEGDIAAFLQQSHPIVGDVQAVLDEQVARLSAQEQEVLYWLAIEREAIEPDSLRDQMLGVTSRQVVSEALGALRRRSLVERSAGRFQLQNVVTEYMTARLVEGVCEQITSQQISLLVTHPLLQAQAKDYVRESQRRLILKPIAERLQARLGKKRIEERLKGILSTLRQIPQPQQGYAGGNILNLLLELNSDLSGYDLSQLTLWEAYLAEAEIQDVNLAHADLTNSVFSDTFAQIHSLAWSPNGQLLAAGTSNGEIRVWQAADGKSLLTCQAHSDWIRGLAFSPDGSILASSSDDQTIKLWSIRTGRCLRTLKGHVERVFSVAFSPTGDILASAGQDHTVRLWNIQSGECFRILRGHTSWVWSVAFRQDNHNQNQRQKGLHESLLLASSSGDQTIRLWDVETGESWRTLEGHQLVVWSIAFSRDGRYLVSGCYDQTVRLWEISTGNCLHTFESDNDNGGVREVDLSPDGRRVVSANRDGRVRVWDIETKRCLHTLPAHIPSGARSVRFHPSGQLFASGGEDRTVRLWEVGSGKCIKTLQGYTGRVRAVAITPSGQMLASGGGDQLVRLWDMNRGPAGKFRHLAAIRSLAFTPDGHVLAACDENRTIKVWEIDSGECITTLEGHSSTVFSLAFHPNGDLLASGSNDLTVRLWDILTGRCVNVLQANNDEVYAVAFSPDGKILATGGEDNIVHLWNVRTAQVIKKLSGHTSGIWSLSFHPNGRLLASGSSDRTVRIWDLESEECRHQLRGHTNQVKSVAFSPNGEQLASASYDQSVRVWDTQTGECLSELTGHTKSVWSVVFTPDGKKVVTGSEDETIRLWDVQTGTCLRILRGDRPYERMIITGLRGVSEAQKAALLALGAVEQDESLP